MPPPTAPSMTSFASFGAVRANATAEDAVDPESRETRNQEAEAADLLKEFLREWPYRKPAKECEQFLRSQGFVNEEG